MVMAFREAATQVSDQGHGHGQTSPLMRKYGHSLCLSAMVEAIMESVSGGHRR